MFSIMLAAPYPVAPHCYHVILKLLTKYCRCGSQAQNNADRYLLLNFATPSAPQNKIIASFLLLPTLKDSGLRMRFNIIAGLPDFAGTSTAVPSSSSSSSVLTLQCARQENNWLPPAFPPSPVKAHTLLCAENTFLVGAEVWLKKTHGLQLAG